MQTFSFFNTVEKEASSSRFKVHTVFVILSFCSFVKNIVFTLSRNRKMPSVFFPHSKDGVTLISRRRTFT